MSTEGLDQRECYPVFDSLQYSSHTYYELESRPMHFPSFPENRIHDTKKGAAALSSRYRRVSDEWFSCPEGLG